ncbi:hypothetical protein CCR75_009460 [Bremia lactucae]|uniref:Uncharacterized protein n=1 Tax=Bremia lactucae TaxID=4779 RepID=A0A976IC42_BRELC|nr:hypothetical protein CCR75_009460 [Bremia lactucae]
MVVVTCDTNSGDTWQALGSIVSHAMGVYQPLCRRMHKNVAPDYGSQQPRTPNLMALAQETSLMFTRSWNPHACLRDFCCHRTNILCLDRKMQALSQHNERRRKVIGKAVALVAATISLRIFAKAGLYSLVRDFPLSFFMPFRFRGMSSLLFPELFLTPLRLVF